jgi:hypothetical protein
VPHTGHLHLQLLDQRKPLGNLLIEYHGYEACRGEATAAGESMSSFSPTCAWCLCGETWRAGCWLSSSSRSACCCASTT